MRWGDIRKGITAPCKDCPDRHINCHSSCERYAEYKKKNNEQREKDYKERLVTMQLYEMEQERKRKSTFSKRPSSLKHGRKKK